MPEKDDCTKSKDVTDGNDETIKHISGDLNSEDLYALPNKRKNYVSGGNDGIDGGGGGDGSCIVNEVCSDEENYVEEKGKKEDNDGFEDKDGNKDLPPGWEKHEGKLLLCKSN